MPRTGNSHLADVAIFTKAVENVFRRLIRILVGRISLAKLLEMMSFIYVEEAELKLKRASPGKNVPLTKIALMTGLDARTVTNIRAKIGETGSQYQQKILRDLTPESAIVEAWVNLIKATPAKARKEVETLHYGDDHSGFEKLFRATISSRGITPQSIIERLVLAKNVEHNRKEKTVKLMVSHFSPYLSHHEPMIFTQAFAAIANLISTAHHNIESKPSSRFFERQTWTFRLPITDQLSYRRQFRAFLESMEGQAVKKMEPWETKENSVDVMTAGVGFYYFEEAA